MVSLGGRFKCNYFPKVLVAGCLDPNALNFDFDADYDDGTYCHYLNPVGTEGTEGTDGTEGMEGMEGMDEPIDTTI